MNGSKADLFVGGIKVATAMDWNLKIAEAMTPPLPTGDPLESIEMEEGAEYEEAYEYMDGHIEIGRTRFNGEWKKIWVNQYEFTRLPLLEALTDLTPGPVRVLSRKKL